MNKNDLDIFIFIAILLFLLNTYIYLFHSTKEMFWKRVKRGLKKAANVVAKNTGITYVANKTGLSKQVNKNKCINERENARRDRDNEKTYLDNTNSIKNNIDTVANNLETDLKSAYDKVQATIDEKNTEHTNTAFNQQSADAISKQILYQLDLVHESKVEQVEELL